jgi:fumarate reductase flavoprotein subunit
VIVGAGAAGLILAIRASDLGFSSPIVIDKMPFPAGNTIYSDGSFIANATIVQSKQGKNKGDTALKFYDDMINISQGRVDKGLTKLVAEKCNYAIDWLTDIVGVKWSDIKAESHPINERRHVIQGAGGRELIKLLEIAAKKRNIAIEYNTKALETVSDDKHHVIGVRTVGPKGKNTYYGRYGTVLATGGFHAENALVTSFLGGWVAEMPIVGSDVITGDTIKLVTPLSPKFANTAQFHATIIHGPTTANPLPVINKGIIVDDAGLRFVNEAESASHIAKTIAKTGGNNAFVIIDSSARGKTETEAVFKDYENLAAPIYEASDIAELARIIGADGQNLQASVDRYNEAVKSQKTNTLSPINTVFEPRYINVKPFYAIPFQGAISSTFGGPCINGKMQVINTENKPIEGLYAIGSAVGGLFYDDIIPGSKLTASAVFALSCAEELAAVKRA